MIVVKFFDYGAGQIDIEKAMNINIDVIDFLVDKIEELEFEAMDSEADMDDNIIYYFSSNDEETTCSKIDELISSNLEKNSKIQFLVYISDILTAWLRLYLIKLNINMYQLVHKSWQNTKKRVLLYYDEVM